MLLIFKNKETRQYGNNEPSKYVPPEKGRSGIFVMSDGALEKEEIEDIVLAAQEKEDTRIKKGIKRPQKERLEQVTEAVMRAKPKDRLKLAKELARGGN